MNESISLGVIGGSGLYDFPGLQDKQITNISTPFGDPSSPIVLGNLNGTKIAFLARHGIHHQISPTEINYRANIYALKLVGVKNVVSISACGSLREDFVPGDIVIPDQLFDNTTHRMRSFFGDGIVSHVSVGNPFCGRLNDKVIQALQESGTENIHEGGTLITIEGPRFSTKAESNTYRLWGMSIIGMTASPEAFLAREAEMCYSTIAHVTDYDVWHVSESPVTVELVIKVLNKNTDVAKDAIIHLASMRDLNTDCSCNSALENAIITNRKYFPAKSIKKLEAIIGKYIH